MYNEDEKAAFIQLRPEAAVLTPTLQFQRERESVCVIERVTGTPRCKRCQMS